MDEILVALDHLADVGERHIKMTSAALGIEGGTDDPRVLEADAAMKEACDIARPAIYQLARNGISPKTLEFAYKLDRDTYNSWFFSKSDVVNVRPNRSPKFLALQSVAWFSGIGFGAIILDGAIYNLMHLLWFFPLYVFCNRVSHAAHMQRQIYVAREKARTRYLYDNLSNIQQSLGLRSPEQITPFVLSELAYCCTDHWIDLERLAVEKAAKVREVKERQEEELRNEYDSDTENRRHFQSFEQWSEAREERTREAEISTAPWQPAFNINGTMMVPGTNLDVHGNVFGYDPGPSWDPGSND